MFAGYLISGSSLIGHVVNYMTRILSFSFSECAAPDNIHTSPARRFFSKSPPPPPLWKFQLSLIHFFKCFGLREIPTPQEIPIPSVGGSMDIFWNCTMCRSRKYPHSPHRRDWNFLGGGGSVRPKNLKKCIKLYWNFQRGGGVSEKNSFHRGGMDIF